MSFYVFLTYLHASNLRAKHDQLSIKILEKLRTASLNLDVSGSYKKYCKYSLSPNAIHSSKFEKMSSKIQTEVEKSKIFQLQER